MKKSFIFLVIIMTAALIFVGCSKNNEVPQVEAPEQLQDGSAEITETESNEVGDSGTVTFSESSDKSEGFSEVGDVGFGESDKKEDSEEDGTSIGVSGDKFENLNEVAKRFTGTITDASIEDDKAMFMVENPEGAIVFVLTADTYLDESALNVSMGDVITVGYDGQLMDGNPPHAMALSVEAAKTE